MKTLKTVFKKSKYKNAFYHFFDFSGYFFDYIMRA